MQVAHRIGAEDFAGARKILRQSVTATLIFSSLLAVTGITISDMLPSWENCEKSFLYHILFYFI